MDWATIFENAQSGDEGSLDAAFEAVEIASRFRSSSTARGIEERWLWGSGWKLVAHVMGCSRWTAMRRCEDCFAWMDANIVEEDGHARYVGAELKIVRTEIAP